MTIIFTDGKHTQKVEPSQFPHEGKLQQYISDNPDCLPICDIDEDATLMIVGREFHTDHGPIDVLGVDARGNIYIVETKLYKNPDKRKVIAQLFDYGAGLWNGYADTDEFVSALNRYLQAKGQTLDDSLATAFDYDENEGPTDTIEAIQENFREGRFRFIVLMDHVDDRLKTLIAFINANSRFDIYAVELEYYETPRGDVLIPELFGVQVKTPAAKKASASSGTYWNGDRFFADAEQRLKADELEAVRQLYNYSVEQAAEIRWGRRKAVGTFHPKFSQTRVPGNKWRSPYSVSSDGTLWLNMFRAKKKETSLWNSALLSALVEHKVEGVDSQAPKATKLSIGQWKGQVEEIMAAMDEAISSIEQYRGQA